jgi:rhodanese-related sulfurtransferase
MKTVLKALIYIQICFTVIFTSCNNDDVKEINDTQNIQKTGILETEILLNFLEQTGNIINKPEMPFMVSVDEVFDNLNNYLVIDIRNQDDYVSGHIDGAIHVQKENLYDYMTDSVTASSYKKIVLVCYTNHSASYAAMLFRLAGYGNVFSMRYGMSACDKTTAENKWWKEISNKYGALLETKDNPKNPKGDIPVLKTGQSTPYKILHSRIKELIKNFQFTVDADQVFENPDQYYIICYWTADHYVMGHIPGAIQYTPKSSLIKSAELSTLPANKPIAVYDYTGQHASFVTAYLQILGYDAYAIKYGANSFMHDKLNVLGIGNAYNKVENFKYYPLVEGEKPSLITSVASSGTAKATESNNTNNVPPVKKKDKKTKSGGC